MVKYMLSLLLLSIVASAQARGILGRLRTRTDTSLVVTALRLMNADTNSPIPGYDPIVSGAVLDLATLPPRTNLTVEALTLGVVQSVKFESGRFSRTEDIARWVMCGNDGLELFRCGSMRNGFSGTIKATPYAGPSGRGTPGTSLSVKLGIVRKGVLMLTLLESPSNAEISTLINRTFVGLDTYPTLNVRATIADTSVSIGSVAFTLNGEKLPIENNAPYELFNSKASNFKPWEPSIGPHDITAVAYSAANGRGMILGQTDARVRALPRIPEDDGFYDDDDEFGDDDDLYYPEEESEEE
jgi:hypothetical protein